MRTRAVAPVPCVAKPVMAISPSHFGSARSHHDVISAASAGLSLSVLYQMSSKFWMESWSDIE